MKLEKLIVFMRYRSKMTILDRIYLSQIRMRAYSALKDAVAPPWGNFADAYDDDDIRKCIIIIGRVLHATAD